VQYLRFLLVRYTDLSGSRHEIHRRGSGSERGSLRFSEAMG